LAGGFWLTGTDNFAGWWIPKNKNQTPVFEHYQIRLVGGWWVVGGLVGFWWAFCTLFAKSQKKESKP
jgi:hypothetical protein